MPRTPTSTNRLPTIFAASLLTLAGTAHAGVPQDWDIELVCRSSLDPGIPAFRLPQFSSLSSQYVSLDEDGNTAIRVFINGNPNEGIFFGNTQGGSLPVTANSADPTWSVTVETRNGLIALEDATLGPGGASVFDTSGNLVNRFNIGLYGVDGLAGVANDGAIGYRAAVGFSGQGIVLDEFVNGTREQTLVLSTLEPSDDVDFILSPEMNASKQFVANTLPLSGPSRRILRFSPDGRGRVSPRNDRRDGQHPRRQLHRVRQLHRYRAQRVDRLQRPPRRGRAVAGLPAGQPGRPDRQHRPRWRHGHRQLQPRQLPPVVNSNGLVAFRVEDTTGSTALFVGDGSGGPDALARIVGNGDIADTDLGPIPFGFDFGGTTGIQIMNGVVDINDANQVAFAAFLANGTVGVFVATPAGPDGCTAADLAEPFGVLDLADLQTFVQGFLGGDPIADLAVPEGVLDLADVQAFITSFNAGCP